MRQFEDRSPANAGNGAVQENSGPSMEEAVEPLRAGRAITTELSPVVLPSRGQLESEAFCDQLPLYLCHGCDGCGMRCTEGVRMTRGEFVRVQAYLEQNPAEAARVQAQDKSIPGWPVTKFCQFRDTEKNGCFIYPVRPIICRFFGHTEWLPCPLEIVPLKGQDAMDVYQGYAEEELRTFDEWRRSGPNIQEVSQADTEVGAD